MVMGQGAVNIAGAVKVLRQGDFPRRYPEISSPPAQTRALFDAKGWSTVAAFQTRNPMHRSHEYLVRTAAEICDGVLVHSPLGKLKAGDVPAEVACARLPCCSSDIFRTARCLQAGYPLAMRYAGPREALLHALFRQNYGCSHIVIGRDHAGVGDFYEPLRRAADIRRDSAGRAEDPGDENRPDFLVLSLRRHGFGAHLPARPGRPADSLGYQAAPGAVRGCGNPRRVQPAGSPASAARILWSCARNRKEDRFPR